MINTSNSHPKWISILIVILIAQSLTVAAFNVSAPILPLILHDLFGMSGSQLTRWNGWLMSLPSLMMALFSPIWGSMADRFGKRLMLLRALLGGMIVIGLMGLVQSPMQLLVLRGMQGAFTGSIAAATVLILTFVPKEKSAMALALFQVAIHIGHSAGPLLGGTIYDVLGGRINFFITSAMLALAIFIVINFVPKDTKESAIKQKKSLASAFKPDFSALKGNSFLKLLLFTAFFVSISFSLVNSIFILYIRDILRPDQLASVGTITGAVVGASSLSLALGAICFARLGKYFPMERLILVSMTGAAIFYIPQLFSHSWQMVLSIRVVESFFVGGVAPAINYLISSHTDKEKHGSIFGLNASLNAIGLSLGPVIGVAVATAGWGGFRAVFITGSIFLITLMLTLYVSQNRISKEASPL